MSYDFEQFQKHFRYYQNLFNLSGYKIYFKHEPLERCFAEIDIAHETMIATVSLNSELEEDCKEFLDIKQSARHEALHLLLGRMKWLACQRNITADELYTAEEEAVHRLEAVIE